MITFPMLIRRSLRFHARSHLGVVLGAAIGSAALIGALVVGDSVRGSLRDRAVQRLAGASFALAPADRYFDVALGQTSFTWLSGRSQGLRALPSEASRNQFRRAATATLLALPASMSLPSGTARANQVRVYGATTDFWAFVGGNRWSGLAEDAVLLNRALAAQLGARVGDEVLLRVGKPRHLSMEAAVSPRDDQVVGLRLKVAGILPPELGGELDLHSGGAPALNAFVSLEPFSARLGISGKANVFLVGSLFEDGMLMAKRPGLVNLLLALQSSWREFLTRHGFRRPLALAATEESLSALSRQLKGCVTLSDFDLKLQPVAAPFAFELRSPRVFLDPPVAAASERLAGTNGVATLTFLANLMVAGTNSAPYSMVTAAGPPYTPPDLRDDEILISTWLAEDLHIAAGDSLCVSYFLPESGARLAEGTNCFRVRGIYPLEGLYADRTLMPDFPGIEKAESTHDWDAGFPLVYKIRPKDEQYWKDRRGTPKAFVSLRAGRKIWGNRFGDVTSIRFRPLPNSDDAPLPDAGFGAAQTQDPRLVLEGQLLASLDPAQFGLRFEPVREQALRAADQAQDFGQLFVGFSLFLVVAAALLMALLFQFGLEQRAAEVGTLLALGFTPRQVRRLLLGEGAALAFAGGLLGVCGGLGYAKAMLWGLGTVWRGAVGAFLLSYHVTVPTLITGLCSSTLVAVLTIWITLRKQARQSPCELLVSGFGHPDLHTRSRGLWIGLGAGLGAVAVLGWALATRDLTNAGAFFGGGSLVLVCGLGFAAHWLAAVERRASPSHLTLFGLGVRGCARRRKRSVATMALLASGCFVIVSIGVFRLDANQNASRRTSGTGGFALLGESTLPVVQDLDTEPGRETFGLGAKDLIGVHVVGFRVRAGDEASCLNLNRAQKPRLLGVNPALLADRFTFVSVAGGGDRNHGWSLLSRAAEAGAIPDEIPAIGDANSIQWALGKKVGDTIDYSDERGRAVKLRLVGSVANSILQGSLVIDEAEFLKHFPSESGCRMFLLDAPSNSLAQVSATLTRALQDVGLQLTPASERLNAFNAVQNTYLGTFQILGGLGLLLGSAGLGAVVLRNVLERRAELGSLLAVGFRRRALQFLVLSEHGALLIAGLGLGVGAAAVAVLPALLTPGTPLPYGSLAVTLGAVLANGALWSWLATRYALRGDLLAALRNE